MPHEQATAPIVPLGFSGRRLVISLDAGMVFVDLPPKGRLLIGRGIDADVVLDHRSISRKHAAIEIDDVVRVEDLGSANGTKVGGRRLEPGSSAQLVPGIVLELGTVLVTLQDERADSNIGANASDVVIADPMMQEVLETVRIAAGSNLSVLLLGETGVGKEVLARRLHDLSARRTSELVKVNCAALVESLLEAELFGYERGAFTGALQPKPGLLETASKGTMFLDELGELPLATQAKLLRVLESGEVTRVGGVKPRSVDVRFVSATHRDLKELVAAGRFREDLFHRLDGVSIRIPPLRDRPAEIAPLAERFVRDASVAAGRPAPTLGKDAIDRLLAHPWAGNVRQLRNVIQRSVLFCQRPVVRAEDLRFEAFGTSAPSHVSPAASSTTIDVVATRPAPEPSVASAKTTNPATPPAMSKERAERRQRVIEALEKAVWNQTRAAETLGVARRTLQSWMVDLEIPRPRGSRRS